MSSIEVATQRRVGDELPAGSITDTFSLCQLCASMTAKPHNAKRLNSRIGFKHLSRRELALSSRYCTFCFWLWSQLHRSWQPGSPGHLYLFATGRDTVIDVFGPPSAKPGDLAKVQSVSMRQEGWLTRADHIEGKVKFPAGTPRSSRQPNSARFQIEGIRGSSHPSVRSLVEISKSRRLLLGGASGNWRQTPQISYATEVEVFETGPSNVPIPARNIYFIANDPKPPLVLESQHNNSSINESIEKIARWLSECYYNHKVCGTPVASSLPARVIDVGLEDSDQLKLFVSQGQKDYYIALSYCWGGKQDYVTTMETIDSKQKTLLWGDLPQTIQDAITITRRLRIQYLWVDALCIIQDSTRDKAVEINAMGEVYKNALFTFAATSAVSASDGFLRHTPSSQTFWIPGLESTKAMLRPIDMYVQSVDKESLDTRGWALQESLLSPRLLSFGERELSWRCQKVAFEKERKGHRICKRLPSGVFGIALDDESTIETNQELVWEAIVEDYSGRELTVPEDRLPAIAGIVGELAKLWNDTYLAGLWSSCLLRHLVWERVGNSSDAPYLAPSWSWASFGGEVAFKEKVDKFSAEVLACDVQALDKRAAFGQVKAGLLVLKASCLRGFQARGPSSFWHEILDHGTGITLDLKDAYYILLGYNLEEGAIGLTLRRKEDGKYLRTGMWSGARVDVKVWSRSCATTETFEIV